MYYSANNKIMRRWSPTTKLVIFSSRENIRLCTSLKKSLKKQYQIQGDQYYETLKQSAAKAAHIMYFFVLTICLISLDWIQFYKKMIENWSQWLTLIFSWKKINTRLEIHQNALKVY